MIRLSSSNNRLITEELDFDMNSLQQESHQLLDSLTIEQRSVFDEIMTAVKQKKGVLSNITTNIQTPSSTKFVNIVGNNENVSPTLSCGYQQTRVQSISNIYIDSPLSNKAKDKRKERKIYLDTRRSNHMSTVPIGNVGRDQQHFQYASDFFTRTPLSNISNVNAQYSTLSGDMRATNSSSVTQASSSNLSCRKLNRKRKIPNISQIPILDLTSDEDLRDQQIRQQLISDYLDHGDQTFVCTMCHAQLWTYEALKGNTSGKKTSYSMCCGNGKVELPQLKQAPTNYQNLFRNVDPKGKNFMKNIRRFNSMFSFTSMGGKVDSSINRGNAPYVFRLSGQNYHCMGSLLPIDGSKPKFSQLYIYDTENEITNRQRAFSTQNEGCTSTSHSLDIEIIRFLKDMLDSTNELVKCYRMARDCFDENPHIDLKLRLIGRRQQDGRTYNLPTASEVAALIVGDIGDAIDNRDIIVTTKSGSLQHLKKKRLLGLVKAVVYTVEFQKRGLPHAHICLFMHPDYKLPTVEHIDRVISAEIPNKDDDPELYSLVSEFMMHGPCGSDNPKCPCMSENKCSKNFPKPFLENTSVDSNGYPMYRRRNDGSFIEKSGVKLDNRSVVPYHKTLLKRYQAHINVEWCNQAASIKYLFKYINKGPDRATVEVAQNNNGGDNDDAPVDEIKNYYDCRYLSACEASWRIYGFDVHYRYPSVVRLPFHLPGKQNVVYGADDDIEDVLNKQSVSSSMFLSWMSCNEHNEDARKLSYVEFPTKFVWKQEDRCWEPRKKGFSIGRIHTVSPNLGEAYFLRILLNKVKGPKSFPDIRTVNGQVCPTFRDACYALGLLEDDREYIDAIEEASHSGSGYYLRFLFATMLKSNSLSKPCYVWENTCQYLSDGILYNQRIRLKSPGLSLNDDQLKNLTLYEIEKILLQNNSSLKDFVGMPYPDHDSISSSNNPFDY
ncbi:unnamed protein product [Lactuca virosa]|uniref:Helitron helicase-like domain-containing protein n=1 Tax=Lactuca virosa TaxID=75947 RepID=A0AAU9MMN1_9ASTR|nr:unnamed protein product [Lactuca virosa]